MNLHKNLAFNTGNAKVGACCFTLELTLSSGPLASRALQVVAALAPEGKDATALDHC